MPSALCNEEANPKYSISGYGPAAGVSRRNQSCLVCASAAIEIRLTLGARSGVLAHRQGAIAVELAQGVLWVGAERRLSRRPTPALHWRSLDQSE